MNGKIVWILSLFLFLTGVNACRPQPYGVSNRLYKKQAKYYARVLKLTPLVTVGADSLPMSDYWVGTTNFNLRKPNFVIIHHTAQEATTQTLQTFTRPQTQVSAHYVIGRDGKIYHLLNDYFRGWHGGVARWGNITDINSVSLGIELDNNGLEPFAEAQLNSLLLLLARLKKAYNIPTANFIGHSDVAPTRKNDPNPHFPWKKLAAHGYGFWYDEDIFTDTLTTNQLRPQPTAGTHLPGSRPAPPDSIIPSASGPLNLNAQEALRIIGYDTQNLPAAIRAFKHHFIQTDITAVLTRRDSLVLHNLYQKYF